MPVADEAAIADYSAREARRQQRARVELAMNRANVPKRFLSASLDEVSELPDDAVAPYRAAVDALRALLSQGVTLALVGRRGPGKTHMACALVNAFCRAGRSGVYLHAMDYFQELKKTYGDRSRRDESQVEIDYVRPELLVVDELHERGDTPWEDRMLTRLINKRYENELATVLIANLTPGEFEKRVGTSIVDRTSGVVVCDWPSLRGRLRT
jgi:DNA replication protein DnaC